MDPGSNPGRSTILGYKTATPALLFTLSEKLEALHFADILKACLYKLSCLLNRPHGLANVSENGVRILDRTIGNGVSKGRIIDVYFKPDKILCEYCQTDNCRHVEFALNIPKVKKILIEKGWPISKNIIEE